MIFPQRPSAHIKETDSWKILQNSVPSEWLLRGVTERDYGVDCYLEMIGRDGSVRGDLISIQLKGTECLECEAKGTLLAILLLVSRNASDKYH